MSGRGRGYSGRGGGGFKPRNNRGGSNQGYGYGDNGGGGNTRRGGWSGRGGVTETPGTKRKREEEEESRRVARRLRLEEEDRAKRSEGTSSGGRGGAGGRGTGTGTGTGRRGAARGRNWTVQAAELWGASEEAMEFVKEKAGKEQVEKEEERRRRMRPELTEKERKDLERAGKAKTVGEAVELMTGVIEGVVGKIGDAVEAVREETVEWRRDVAAHLAATDRQNRKRHLEFTSPALKIPPGNVVTEDQCLRRLSEITEEKYGVVLTWEDVAACHPLPSGAGSGRAIALFKNTNEGSPYARLLHLGEEEGWIRGLSSRVYLKVEMSASAYDGTLREALHWYKEHAGFMRKEAAKKGWKPEEAVPGRVYVTRYNNERSGKLTVTIPGHRNVTVTSAKELVQLIGQRCLDAFVMRVPAQSWITPRKPEELPPPVNRVSGGNREPVGERKNQEQPGREENRSGSQEEKQQEEEEAQELGEGSPEIERGGGERDRSLQASPTLDLSEGEEKGEKEKNPKGEKEKNPKVEEIKRKTTELKRKMRKATFDWNEGRYV